MTTTTTPADIRTVAALGFEPCTQCASHRLLKDAAQRATLDMAFILDTPQVATVGEYAQADVDATMRLLSELPFERLTR